MYTGYFHIYAWSSYILMCWLLASGRRYSLGYPSPPPRRMINWIIVVDSAVKYVRHETADIDDKHIMIKSHISSRQI